LFSEFPLGCEFYQGPNSEICFNSIWLDVGCAPEGYRSPMNGTNNLLTVWQSYNLR